MNDLSFQKSPDKSQISYFLLCSYIGSLIPVARLESDRLLKHAQSLQLAGDKSHTILPGIFTTMESDYMLNPVHVKHSYLYFKKARVSEVILSLSGRINAGKIQVEEHVHFRQPAG